MNSLRLSLAFFCLMLAIPTTNASSSLLERAQAELSRLSSEHPGIKQLDSSSRRAIVAAMSAVFLDISSAHADTNLTPESSSHVSLAHDSEDLRSVDTASIKSQQLTVGEATVGENHAAVLSSSNALKSSVRHNADAAFEATMAEADAKRAPLSDVRFLGRRSLQRQHVLASSSSDSRSQLKSTLHTQQMSSVAHALVDSAITDLVANTAKWSELKARPQDSLRLSELGIGNKVSVDSSSDNGAVFDASTGLAEPTAECKRVLNTWLGTCVFGPPPQ